MTFLPDNYEAPKAWNGSYTKFIKWQNKIRVLSSAITGRVVRTDDGDKRTPNRAKDKAKLPVTKDDPKHFWAFVVYNYNTEAIEVCEITQKSIQDAVLALAHDEDWGDPQEYDIKITRTGEWLDTKYSVSPSPKSEVSKDIAKLYKETPINLDALYEGENPFDTNDVINDLPF